MRTNRNYRRRTVGSRFVDIRFHEKLWRVPSVPGREERSFVPPRRRVASSGGGASLMRLSTNALDELYRRHNRALKGLAKRRVGWEDSEDVVQEAYLRLLELESAGGVTDMRGYLYRVASNVAIDWLRKRKTRSTCVVENVEFEDIAVGESGFATAAEEAILVHRVQIGLSQLPRGCCETFLLNRLYGMTCPEIAERQGISLRTVNRNISRTVDHLRFALEWETDATMTRDRNAADASGRRAPALAAGE